MTLTLKLIRTAVLAGFALAALPAAAFTGSIFFEGACADCTPDGGGGFGPGTASATISLADYTWGDALPMSVGFTYTSERMGTLSPPYAYNALGSFSGVASAPADVYLEFNIFDGPHSGFYTFDSNLDGSWQLYTPTFVFDYGSSHSWSVTTAVPEPETYAMLLAGLGLLGFAARRRKTKLAA